MTSDPIKEWAGVLDSARWEDRVYVGGSWVAGEGRSITVTSPADGASLAAVGIASADDVAKAAASAGRMQPAWAAASFAERAEVLRRAGDFLVDNSVEIEEWMVHECGSVRTKARLELARSVEECVEAAALAAQPFGETLRSPVPRISFSRRMPVGVVGVIAPFNAPLLLSIRSIAPALALGNAVLLKPDLRTPISGGALLATAFEQAGLPPGLLSVLPGDGEIGEAVVRDPNVRVIAFTGSTETGRAVGALCGELLKRAHLELGGNSALIVMDDVDLDRAVQLGADATFTHAGQICMAAGRHIVAREIADEYTEALAARSESLVVGDPADARVDVGPLIDEHQRDRVHHLVTETIAAGARPVAGGIHERLFYRPTVLADVPTSAPAWKMEVFGPVAPIVPYDDIEHAISLARDTEYGLSLGILAGDGLRALEISERIPSGAVHINDHTIHDEAAVPFGGVGLSGNGSRNGGLANLEAFTETQWVTARSSMAVPSQAGTVRES